MMRITITVAWAVLLTVLTCNLSLKELVLSQAIEFRLNTQPDYVNLFSLDFNVTHSKWILVKLGHCIGFAIMNVLLIIVTRNRSLSMMISIVFAIATEILQLYFYRDGRLFDIMVDTAGIFLANRYNHFLHRWLRILRLERKV